MLEYGLIVQFGVRGLELGLYPPQSFRRCIGVLVQDGDRVYAGDRLCEGPVNPHDILRISGEYAVQRYLVDEIQDVYRLQGVSISDKHIEIIVRQMLQKVRIVSPGDTQFLEGDVVERPRVV